MSDNNKNTAGHIDIKVSGQSTRRKSAPKKKQSQNPRRQVNAALNAERSIVAAEKKILARVLGRGSGGPGNIATLPSRPQDLDECLGVQIPKMKSYLACLVCPREFEGCRVPDCYTRAETACYQTKLTFNILGITGAAVSATNLGRFSFILNPVISDSNSFDAVKTGWQLAMIDGSGTGPWPGYYQATSAGVNFTSYALDPNQPMFAAAGTGLMQKVRPVSASVLASYNGQLINGGGNIAIHCVPGDSWQNNLANSTAGVSFANWEALAATKKAYDGELVKGAYCIWLPDDETDYLMRDPVSAGQDTTKQHCYPFIVCSGQVSAPAGYVSPNPFPVSLRIDCYINFEYTTLSRVVTAMHGPDDIRMREIAMRALKKTDISMENATHEDWIKVILAGAAGFLAGGPVGAVLAAATVATGTNLLGLKGK